MLLQSRSLDMVELETKRNSHKPQPKTLTHKRIALWLFCTNFEINAIDAKADSNNADVAEADKADEAYEANKAVASNEAHEADETVNANEFDTPKSNEAIKIIELPLDADENEDKIHLVDEVDEANKSKEANEID